MNIFIFNLTKVLWGSDWKAAISRWDISSSQSFRFLFLTSVDSAPDPFSITKNSESPTCRQNMTGVALCHGVFITDDCNSSSSQCNQTKLYAGLAKQVRFWKVTIYVPILINFLSGRKLDFKHGKLRKRHNVCLWLCSWSSSKRPNTFGDRGGDLPRRLESARPWSQRMSRKANHRLRLLQQNGSP